MSFKSTLHAEKPSAGEIWLSQSTGNYFRIDSVDGQQVSVTRLGYTSEGRDYLTRKPSDDSHVWHISTFPGDFRRIARKSERFEAFLSQNAVNKAA